MDKYFYDVYGYSKSNVRFYYCFSAYTDEVTIVKMAEEEAIDYVWSVVNGEEEDPYIPSFDDILVYHIEEYREFQDNYFSGYDLQNMDDADILEMDDECAVEFVDSIINAKFRDWTKIEIVNVDLNDDYNEKEKENLNSHLLFLTPHALKKI